MDLSHFQHLVQTSAAGFAPDVTPHPVTLTLTDAAGSPSVFPFTEVIDLSTSANEQCPGEKTPGPYGEVPGFLLDIARGCSTVPCPKTSAHSHSRAGSTARVCLEKRFKILSADPSNYQEIRYGPPSQHILPLMNQSVNAHPVSGFWQSSSSLRRPRFSPGPASTGQTRLRFPAHLSWGFSTRSPTCATRYVRGGKEIPNSAADYLMALLLSTAGDGPPPSRRRAEAADQDFPVPPRLRDVC